MSFATGFGSASTGFGEKKESDGFGAQKSSFGGGGFGAGGGDGFAKSGEATGGFGGGSNFGGGGGGGGFGGGGSSVGQNTGGFGGGGGGGFGGGGSSVGQNTGGFGGGGSSVGQNTGGGGFGQNTGGGGFGQNTGGGGFGQNTGGGFGGGEGGRGGGGGGGTCYNCNGTGHMSRDCPEPRKPKGGTCYNCGIEGHLGRDCPEPKKPRTGGDGSGGFGGGGGGGRACFNCGNEGHQSRECPEPKKPRAAGGGGGFGAPTNGFGGGSTGFGSSASGFGSQSAGFGGGGGGFGGGGTAGGETGAFGGGGTGGFGGGASSGFGNNGNSFGASTGGGGGGEGGHSGGGGGMCYNCNQEGHRSRDCTEPRKPRQDGFGADGGSARGPMVCHNCSKEGHRARDCTEPAKSGMGGDMSGERKPPSNYVPTEESADDMFKYHIEKGTLFEKLMTCSAELHIDGKKADEVPAINDFETAQLTPLLLENVKAAGYKEPTPVQRYGIPVIRQKYDLMACAQTGSGKTAAYLLPILSILLEEGDLSNSSEDRQQPRVIILAPTRELARQIWNEGRKFAKGTVCEIQVVYGGTSVSHQQSLLIRGVSVLVATPGRLLQFVEEGVIGLSKLRFLVVDEADRMLDQGFLPALEKLSSHPDIPAKSLRQTVMFSATFPDSVQNLAKTMLNESYAVLAVGRIGSANSCITQEIKEVERSAKKDALLQLLKIDVENYTVEAEEVERIKKNKTLVFVGSKKFADMLGVIICDSGLPATTIHGDRFQQQREEALRDFRSGKRPILIATAVAERGLDIVGVDHVINYDMPEKIDEYVHRIGRTARAGNPGRATSFYDASKDSPLAADLVTVLTEAGQTVPEFLKNSGGSFGGMDDWANGETAKTTGQEEEW